MYLKCCRSLLFGVVYAVLMTGVITYTSGSIKEPTGPKLCQRLCNLLVRCSSYIYMTFDLSCHVTDVTTKPDPEKGIYLFQASKETLIIEAQKRLKCQKNEKLFHTRRNTLLCRRQDASKRQLEHKMTRLLLFAYIPDGAKEAVPVKQIFLHNISVVSYPHFATRHPVAVAYLAALGKTVVADERELFLVNLNSGHKTVIKKGVIFRGIAVDENKQLMFLTAAQPRFCVVVMTTEGKDYKQIIELKHYPGDIAADSKRSVIYVIWVHSKLVQYTYDGVVRRYVFKGKISARFYHDIWSDCIYYMTGVTINKMSLSNGNTSVIYNGDVYDLVVSGASIYMSTSKGCDLIVLSGKGDIKMVNTGFTASTCVSLKMCLEP